MVKPINPTSSFWLIKGTTRKIPKSDSRLKRGLLSSTTLKSAIGVGRVFSFKLWMKGSSLSQVWICSAFGSSEYKTYSPHQYKFSPSVSSKFDLLNYFCLSVSKTINFTICGSCPDKVEDPRRLCRRDFLSFIFLKFLPWLNSASR